MSHSYPIRRLALGCSALALATALAMPAQAQSSGSFQGNANVVFGSANVTTGTGTTNVNVGSASAVIDWTPFDTAISANAPINWQPAGTTATYTGTAGNFAVLNRIVPTDTSRPITFNGAVISQIQQGQSTVRGGTVFFYSPGGIVLSPTAVFDVGNLGLTTAPPVVGPNGDWYTNNTVQFGQSASVRSIRINAGAQITASAEGSYVAAFAPQINQFGNISVNGQAALVAGEAGTITFSPDGLFNIQVTAGTDQGFGINHQGTTGGPASSGPGDNHRIYMVAIPKNNAMQLLIERGSSVGFAIAGAADVQGNAVVLSAGRNVTGGQIDQTVAGGPGEAIISINDSNTGLTGTGIDFTSAMTARASGRLFVDVFRQTRFASDAFLRGDALSQVSVGTLANTPAGALTVGGALTISAQAAQTTAGATGDAGTALLTVTDGATATITRDLNILAGTNNDRDGNGVALGGTAQMNLSGAGSVTVGRDLIIDTSGFSDGAPGAPDARGGNTQVNLNSGSSLTVGRVARLHSYGIAGLNNGAGGQGGDATGGFSALNVNGASTFATSELNIAADGVGGGDVGAGAGSGVGGTAQLIVQGANSRATVTSANVTGDINLGERDFVSAEGFGGQTATANGIGGSAQGGSAALQASAGGQITLPTNSGTNQLRLLARAYGGNVVAGTAGTGGAATGGTVSMFLDNGTLTNGSFIHSSFAQGGSSTNPALATSVINGGNAIGGTRNITIQNGSTFSAAVGGGGPGAVGGNGSATGRGGDGSGGTASTVIDNSTLNVPVGNFQTFSQNFAGAGAIHGNASGGSASVIVRNNATVNIANGASFSATANNFTGTSPSTGPAQSGGNVVAGNALMQILNSSILGGGTIDISSSAFVDHSALTGGNGTGGAARLEVTNGSIQANSLTVRADGNGSDFSFTETPRNGLVGGNGTGGTATAVLNGGTVNVSNFEISAEGSGGTIDEAGSTNVTGGAGQGGTALLQGAGGTSTVTAANLRIDSSGSGGTLFGGTGTGGSGTGGEARIDALGGARLTVNAPIDIIAEGDGGSARQGGTGGAATGGRAYSLAAAGAVTSGGGGTIALGGDVFIDASASSGDGTTAGTATGGLAYLQSSANASTTVTGNVFVRADAYGGFYVGSGGAGGLARGGTAQILASNGNARLTLDQGAEVSASAFGGIGARDANGNGGNGGEAIGGLAEIGGSVGTGNQLAIAREAIVEANADAGYGDSTSGGNATGGRAFITGGDGTAVSLGDYVRVEADAVGGDVFLTSFTPPPGTRAGNATGGTARIRTFNTGGSVSVVDSVTLSSFAIGGSADAEAGVGGDALAGFAEIFARGGNVSIGGALFMGVETQGGSGSVGGDAVLSQSQFFETGLLTEAGSITVAGQAIIYGSASGGDGENGGAGGAAVAPSAYVDAGSSEAGSSTITLGDLQVYSAANGGNGGDATGAAGGAGGAANSTNVQVFGNAGNGRLSVTGTTQLFALAIGGAGGASDTATGGTGGAASAGRIQFGTRSGVDAGPVNSGSASFVDVSAQSQGVGGQGGNSASGTGGAGGSGSAFGGVLLVRGSPVTADSVSILGFGSGGSGGSGATAGAGGYGAGGVVNFTASQRFERTERGSATIGSLSLFSLGQGGTGATPGASYYAADGGVFLTQSDVTVGSLSYTNIGELAPPPAVAPSVLPISLVLSSASLAVDTLSMSTPGEFLLNLDNSSITANSFAISAGTFILPATPPAVPGTVTVRDSLSLAATAPGGSVRSFANFVSNNAASFSSVDSIVLGNIDVEGLFAATSQTGTVTVGNIDAGSASLAAQGNIQAGNIQVTQGFTASSANGAVTTGTINAATASVSGQLDVVTGNALTSGRYVAISRAGSVTAGSITASSADLVAAANVTAGAISLAGPLNLQATSGSISLGTVDATAIQFAAGGGFSASRIGATSIAGNAGGTLTVLGAWSAPSMSLIATDIAIPDGGSLNGGASGTINLIARNEQGAFIGDGLSGQGGYRLSNAEFGRISANTIFVGARDFGNAVDMMIGTLSIAASQLPGTDGSLEFATGILETSQPGGRIRVDGAVTGTGFSASQYLSFTTGSFELNAETGSIALAGSGIGGLGGIVEIDAANIHVASPAILAKLRDNPRYTGVAEEINAPAATPRPDGVLRALGLQFFPSDTLYIQNTGTANSPAGFYTTPDESDIEPPGFENSQAPDVDVVINGRFATATGDISGRDVFSVVADDEEATFDGFSANSQINGCVFTAEACGGAPVSEDRASLAVVQSEIELLSGQTVEEEPFDLEESSEEEEEESEQAARAPIEPPVILIDTRPLNPPLDIVDPVSGSGNPASLAPEPVNPGAGDDQ